MVNEEKLLTKIYNPQEIEPPISELWLTSRAFHAEPDERGPDKRYVIMMPLPNVTGALHMGHAMDNVMQDLLIRWHRMLGDNTLWMPGTDHAGIATQAVVEKRLKELEGLTRHDVGREGLVERIWRWKDQYQARIISQQQRMGCSCDWERQRFTMDKVCARAVREAFFRMFKDGLIFRGKRLVNWDTYLHTTISDDEMYYETVAGFFWYLRYPVINPEPGEPEYVVVATTRPETMLGDTACAVHPEPAQALNAKISQLEKELAKEKNPELEAQLEDLKERQQTLLPLLEKLVAMAKAGRMLNLPLLNRPIPIILDEWAKPDLGTGCVKITPAHDHNDYNLWLRHKDHIGIINILNPDGTLNEAAGPYQGLERYLARERVVADLKKLGLLEKCEERQIEIGHSDRSKTPVEPFLSDQWFIKMGDLPDGIRMGAGTSKEFTSPGLVQAAMDVVIEGRIEIHPQRYTKTYLDWLAEKRDWPISRQLWWGHRIPVWTREFTRKEFEASLVPNQLAELIRSNKDLSQEFVLKLIDLKNEKSHILKQSTQIAQVIATCDLQDPLRIEICLRRDEPTLIEFLTQAQFVQDPDVLDTWFSSALWPFSTLGWPDPETAEIDPGQAALGSQNGQPNCLAYYYPGSCLVTARDIITLWVARMVIMGLYNLGDVPFRNVFIHANILDGKGVRMSKSKGNGIDPVDIIETYGTDAMRYVLCDMQTGMQDIRLPVTAICPRCGYHNDLALTQHGSSIFCYMCGKNVDGSFRPGACGQEFDVLGTMPNLPQAKLISERFEIGKAFCTKLWNAARFVLTNLAGDSAISLTNLTKDDLALEDRFILSLLQKTIAETEKGLGEYNPSHALNTIREFFWGSFCDWYLEAVKPRLAQASQEGQVAREVLAYVLDELLRLLHPFLPFITEAIWQKLNQIKECRALGKMVTLPSSKLLIHAEWPKTISLLDDPEAEKNFLLLQQIVRALRELKAERKLPPRQQLQITFKAEAHMFPWLAKSSTLLKGLANVREISFESHTKRPRGAASLLAGELVFFVHNIIDEEKEKERLLNELMRIEKEIQFIQTRLAQPEFVAKAPPAVVANHKEKLKTLFDSKEKINTNLKLLEK